VYFSWQQPATHLSLCLEASLPIESLDMLSLYATLGALLLVLFVLIRIGLVIREIQRNRRRRRLSELAHGQYPIPVLVVLGSGGHTTEMLFMTKNLNPAYYHPIHYCKASTDSTSPDRVRTMLNEKAESLSSRTTGRVATASTLSDASALVQEIHSIPRSREVGQSYVSSVFSTLYSFYFAFVLVGRLQPQLILCNGPGTCIPICFAALIYRVLGVWKTSCKIVFIESYCRVHTLSLTGKLLYYAADLFIVHWKELQGKYPNTVLTNSFIQ
jgi:beta-1,4-N-acetylglucosaminyltransferase